MLRIGHRGAAGWEPQNTRLSFEKAIELECDVIETDLHICRSGELVLCHNAKIDPTSNGTGFIRDMTLTELKRYDFGKGEQILSLDDLLKLAKGRVSLNLELKSSGSGIAAAALLRRAIETHEWDPADFLITSFIHPEVVSFHKLLPQVQVGVLIKAVLLDTAAYLDRLDVSVLVSSIEFIDQKLVDEVHTARKSVYVYTADDSDEIAYLNDIGVDGIISNFPDRINNNLKR